MEILARNDHKIDLGGNSLFIFNAEELITTPQMNHPYTNFRLSRGRPPTPDGAHL